MADSGLPAPGRRLLGWPAVLTGVLCLVGIGVAAYLTYAHYTSATVLACSDKGLVDCAKVTTSSYSRIFGIPVSDTGLVYFVAMAVLCNPWSWSSGHLWLRTLRVVGSLAGVGMVFWLIYVELFRLDAICLYCTIVHAVTVLLFFAIVFGTLATAPVLEEEAGDDGGGAGAYLKSVAP